MMIWDWLINAAVFLAFCACGIGMLLASLIPVPAEASLDKESKADINPEESAPSQQTDMAA